MPVILFAIIFFWTPPHFWALALFVQTDYAKVGIPMMPVVAGEVSTRRQILFYAALLLPLSALPWFIGGTGAVYGVSALALSALFLALSLRVGLRRSAPQGDTMKPEKQLFAYSIIYLFALFAALVVDRWTSAGLMVQGGTGMSKLDPDSERARIIRGRNVVLGTLLVASPSSYSPFP